MSWASLGQHLTLKINLVSPRPHTMTIAGEEHSGALCLLGPSEYLFHQNWLRWNCIQMNWLINAEPSSNVASGLAWKFTSGIHHWSNWWAKLCKLSSVWLRLDLEDQLCWRLVAWWMVAPWRSMEVMPGCLVATAMYCSVALLSGGKCSKCLRPGLLGNYIIRIHQTVGSHCISI